MPRGIRLCNFCNKQVASSATRCLHCGRRVWRFEDIALVFLIERGGRQKGDTYASLRQDVGIWAGCTILSDGPIMHALRRYDQLDGEARQTFRVQYRLDVPVATKPDELAMYEWL